MTTTNRFLGIELNRQGIALLVGLGGLLVVLLIGLQITLPQYNRLADLDGQIAQRNAEIASKQSLLAQLPTLTAERERSAKLLASVASLIPPAEKLPTLLVDTTRLVKASNGELRQFTPSQTKALPEVADSINIQANTAKISLNATFAEVLTLMRNFERLDALVRIENVSLQPLEIKNAPPGTPPSQRLAAEFDLTAYVLGSGPPSTTEDDKGPGSKTAN
ncbi:type 4a pilus biogenesis protein PilO [Gloeobacter morelensis]|uniref:Type 4a pilus biogenesis protein PilO n=1 Tax=Gloeobacter morelensis MG652769 TaxID=2781736 RepID=A0ABY3PM01_9CYAN|nr:type 4a pilus biogenesis protein PilO [Gloeobacter morelensis]UFP94686.1 type 4a pilus biogenesis protein PilO [Gloeobacter morelensis MG652769]